MIKSTNSSQNINFAMHRDGNDEPQEKHDNLVYRCFLALGQKINANSSVIKKFDDYHITHDKQKKAIAKHSLINSENCRKKTDLDKTNTETIQIFEYKIKKNIEIKKYKSDFEFKITSPSDLTAANVFIYQCLSQIIFDSIKSQYKILLIDNSFFKFVRENRIVSKLKNAGIVSDEYRLITDSLGNDNARTKLVEKFKSTDSCTKISDILACMKFLNSSEQAMRYSLTGTELLHPQILSDMSQNTTTKLSYDDAHALLMRIGIKGEKKKAVPLLNLETYRITMDAYHIIRGKEPYSFDLFEIDEVKQRDTVHPSDKYNDNPMYLHINLADLFRSFINTYRHMEDLTKTMCEDLKNFKEDPVSKDEDLNNFKNYPVSKGDAGFCSHLKECLAKWEKKINESSKDFDEDKIKILTKFQRLAANANILALNTKMNSAVDLYEEQIKWFQKYFISEMNKLPLLQGLSLMEALDEEGVFEFKNVDDLEQLEESMIAWGVGINDEATLVAFKKSASEVSAKICQFAIISDEFFKIRSADCDALCRYEDVRSKILIFSKFKMAKDEIEKSKSIINVFLKYVATQTIQVNIPAVQVTWELDSNKIYQQYVITKFGTLISGVYFPSVGSDSESRVYAPYFQSINSPESSIVERWEKLKSEHSLTDPALAEHCLNLYLNGKIEADSKIKEFIGPLVILLLGKEVVCDNASALVNLILLYSVKWEVTTFEEALSLMPMIPGKAVASKQFMLHTLTDLSLDFLSPVDFKDKIVKDSSQFLTHSKNVIGHASKMILSYEKVLRVFLECAAQKIDEVLLTNKQSSKSLLAACDELKQIAEEQGGTSVLLSDLPRILRIQANLSCINNKIGQWVLKFLATYHPLLN